MRKVIRTIQQSSPVGLFFLLVSLIILYPMIPSISSKLPYASNGDIRLTLTIIESNIRNFSHFHFSQAYHLPIVFPLSFTMTAGGNFFGQTLLLLPLYLAGITNLYLLFNLLVLLAYAASGYCAYLFFREWLSGKTAALLAGAAYILLPFRVHNIPQLNLLFNFPIPFAFLFLSRFLKAKRPKALIGLLLSLSAQFLFDLSLGFFLILALAFFFIAHQAISGLIPIRSWIYLASAAVIFLVFLLIVFHPYLQKDLSFSQLDEVREIGPLSYHAPLSFYTNWSSLLFFFKKVIWGYEPHSPGITVFFCFILALWPFAENRLRKTTLIAASTALLLPALVIPVLFQKIPTEIMNQASGYFLLFFLLTLTAFLFQARKTVPKEIQWLLWSWIPLLFFSSRICLPLFNFFQALARFFPFLYRTRGIRTQYIVLLLFLAVAAIGIERFFRSFQKKRTILTIALLLFAAERIRWPVIPEKLADDRPIYQSLYSSLSAQPDHFGLLELPFLPQHTNRYPLFTRFHGKHTYHGLIAYLADFHGLERNPALQPSSGFSGLGDPAVIQDLRQKGIRIILMFKDKILSERNDAQQCWIAMLDHIRLGEERGLYEKVLKTTAGIKLVISERETAKEIQYFLPRFSLAGRKSLQCDLTVMEATEIVFRLNHQRLKTTHLKPGSHTVVLSLPRSRELSPQFNYLKIAAPVRVELSKVRID